MNYFDPESPFFTLPHPTSPYKGEEFFYVNPLWAFSIAAIIALALLTVS